MELDEVFCQRNGNNKQQQRNLGETDDKRWREKNGVNRRPGRDNGANASSAAPLAALLETLRGRNLSFLRLFLRNLVQYKKAFQPPPSWHREGTIHPIDPLQQRLSILLVTKGPFSITVIDWGRKIAI